VVVYRRQKTAPTLPKSRNRQIKLRDLLTFTIGTGIVVAEPGAVPIADALKALQIDEPERGAVSGLAAGQLPRPLQKFYEYVRKATRRIRSPGTSRSIAHVLPILRWRLTWLCDLA
jgi:hypothetical protein